MKIVITVFLTAFIALSIGCGTPGDVRMALPQVSVAIGDKIMDRPEKVSMLRKHHGVEKLHDFVSQKLTEGKVRDSLNLDITISEFRVGWGRDFMSANVVVSEGGKELKRFKSVETTGRRHPVDRMAKGLAKRIYNEIKDI
jgi:hypothetical protein